MRRNSMAIVAVAMTAAMMATAAHAQVKEMRYATAAPEKTPWGAFLLKTIKVAQDASEGTLKITPFFSSQLGDEQTALRQTVRGRIEISGQSGTATSLVVPEIALLSAAYLFENVAQSDCVFDNHVGKIFGPMLDKQGLILLSYVEVGHSIVFSKDALPDAKSAKAMKIRIPPTNAVQVYWNEVGAAGVPMGVVDMIPALKTGQVNGIHTATVYGVAISLHKIAPHITVNNISHDVGTVTVNKKVWEGLTDKQRAALRKTADYKQELRDGIRKAEVGLLGKAEKEGAKVLRPTGAAQASWKAHAKASHEALVKKIGGNAPAVWKEIQAALASCKK